MNKRNKGQKLKKPLSQSSKETVLLVITGITPGVLTETIWALAQENPAVIPDRVITISTVTGAVALRKELLDEVPGAPASIWDQLRMAVIKNDSKLASKLILEEPAKIITARDSRRGRTIELDDIRTPAENEAAADFILDEVRKITANDDCNLIASMAGGRKTMGALLYAAMALLGRHGDRLTHVLISDPYDSFALRPKFYFPLQSNGTHELRSHDGLKPKRLKSKDARIELADIPFPRLRYLFAEQLGRFPGRFSDLVHTATDIVHELSQPVEVMFESETWFATIEGVPIKLEGRDVPFFHFLCCRLTDGETPFSNHHEATNAFAPFLNDWCGKNKFEDMDLVKQWEKNLSPDDLRKRLNSLRDCLKKHGLGRLIPVLFPVRGALGFSKERVTVALPNARPTKKQK